MSESSLPRKRCLSTTRKPVGQLAPRMRADWEPPDNVSEVLERRIRRHREAAKALDRLQWGRTIRPALDGAFSIFWVWAIDEARAKARIADAKHLMRQKGRTIAWHRRRGTLAPTILGSFDGLAQVLRSLRAPGRPNKDLFHDLVTLGWYLAWRQGGGERAPRLKPLARFLELPELGYALPPDRMKRIADEVMGLLGSGEGQTRYPGMASVLANASEAAARTKA